MPPTTSIPPALTVDQHGKLLGVAHALDLLPSESSVIRLASNRLHFLERKAGELSSDNERLEQEVKHKDAQANAWKAVFDRLHQLPEYEAVNQKRPGMCGQDHAIGVIDELVANNRRLTERVTQLKGLAHGYLYGADPAKILGTMEVLRVSPDANRIRITSGEDIHAFSVELSRDAWVSLYRRSLVADSNRVHLERTVAGLEKQVVELSAQRDEARRERDVAQKAFVLASAGQDVLRAKLFKSPSVAPTPPDDYVLRPNVEYVQDGDIVWDHTAISPQWKNVSNVDIINAPGGAPYGERLRTLYHYARPITEDERLAKAIAEMKAVSARIYGILPPSGHRFLRPGEMVNRGDKAYHLDSTRAADVGWQGVFGSAGITVREDNTYSGISYHNRRVLFARPV